MPSYRAVTGFKLEDYITFGIAVCIWFITQSLPRNAYDRERQSINPKTFLATSRVDTGVAQRLYAELTHTYDSARTAIVACGGDPVRASHDFLPFMEKPLYQVRDDVVVPFHLGYLEAKFSGGIYWRILDSLNEGDRLEAPGPKWPVSNKKSMASANFRGVSYTEEANQGRDAGGTT